MLVGTAPWRSVGCALKVKREDSFLFSSGTVSFLLSSLSYPKCHCVNYNNLYYMTNRISLYKGHNELPLQFSTKKKWSQDITSLIWYFMQRIHFIFLLLFLYFQWVMFTVCCHQCYWQQVSFAPTDQDLHSGKCHWPRPLKSSFVLKLVFLRTNILWLCYEF